MPLIPRVIPCLLLSEGGLVKTIRFKDPTYLGDPINIIRIFNDKEVDELVLLDIRATPEGRPPDLRTLSEISSECFMPLGYGGGIRTLEQIEALFSLGIEKVLLNTIAWEKPDLVTEAAREFGSQSIVVSMDVKRRLLGSARVLVRGATADTGLGPGDYARRAEDLGAGEVLMTAVDRDGTMKGYDLELISEVSGRVGIPVIGAGGAASVADFRRAVREAGAAAVAASSIFVFQGPHRAVLISFPERAALEAAFAEE